MDYQNFEIIIGERNSDGYLLLAQSEECGEARGRLTLDPNGYDIQEYHRSVEERGAKREFLIQFGMVLYNYLFNAEIEPIFKESYATALAQKDTGLRILLRIQAPEIAILPWELLYHPSKGCFMGTSKHTPIVRYLEIEQKSTSLNTCLPLSVLVVIPKFPDLNINTEKEKNHLEKIFHALEGYVTVTFLEGNVTTELIEHTLGDRYYNCFHYIGHGEFKDDKGTILLNIENNGIEYIDENRLAGLFRNRVDKMKLVMLNSCEGAKTSSTIPMVGMAPKLIRLGIPAVIAMQHTVFDNVAISFAKTFYYELFKGPSKGRLEVAMTHARNSIASEFEDDRDMCTPVLFVHTREGMLFDPEARYSIIYILDIILKLFSKLESHRLKAVERTYINDLRKEETQELKEALNKVRKRAKFRRYAQIAAIVSVLLMFFLSWINIFDYFNLDTRIETYTMALGEYFTSKTFSDKILIVYAEDESFGKEWRKEKHPMLLNLLSRAGADVIVFDMVFETPTEFDNNFIAALQQAKADRIDVIVGIRDMGKNGPKIVKQIEQAVSGVGITCIGGKLGRARTAPLLVLDKEKGKGESEKDKYYSIALMAYAAYNDYDIWDVDLKESHVNLLLPAEHRTYKMPFAELNRAEDTHACSIIQKGDTVVDIFIDPIPIEMLRKREITYSELIDQIDLDRFKDKIVLIGSRRGDIKMNGISGKSRFGYELHAEVLNTLINGVYIHSLNVFWQMVLMIILGICGALINYTTPGTSQVLRRILCLSIVIAYLVGMILIYAQFRILLNTLYHIGAFGLSYWAAGKIERRVLF